MKLFILEDGNYKLRDLQDSIIAHFPDVEITTCPYLNASIQLLIRGNFDYAILDNNVPRFVDSREFVSNAAEEVLEWMFFKQKNTKCIICSSEDVEIDNYDNLIGVVKYSTISLNWTKQLIKLLTK